MVCFSKPLRSTPFYEEYPYACYVVEKSSTPTILQSCEMAVPIKDRTSALVRGLRLVMEHHGAHELVLQQLETQLHGFLDTSSSEKFWLKRAKHTLTYPLARYLRNEPPPAADSVFRPTGILRQWMKNRIHSFSRKNSHLWYSWFQAKRASLPVSDSIVEETYADHFKALTSPDDGSDSVIEAIFADPTFSRLMNRFTIEIASRMAGEDFTRYAPSTSACFENKRSGGGQCEFLRSKASITHESCLGFSELISMNESHSPAWTVCKTRKFHDTNVVESRMRAGRDDWSDLTTQSREVDNDVPLQCTIQAVLEPMKVRVISKGEALPYYSMKPLQVAMHSILRKMDCFRLIGRPFCPTDMMDLRRKASPTDQWFSVDYSAATDGLSFKYSGRILEEAIRLLPPYLAQRARRVLGMHDLFYPIKHEVFGYGGRVDTEYRGQMARGQLMGSILSFPILCLANLGVYLLVTQDAQRGWTDQERLSHVLINGDDMLYAADQSLWSKHVSTGASVGLNMSIGKAYHHQTYANVNSTSVHYDLSIPTSTPFQVGYLNAGLFFGQHKVQGTSGDTSPIDECLEALTDGEDLRTLSEIVKDRIPLLQLVKNDEGRMQILLDESKDDSIVSSLNVLLEGSLPGRQKGLLKMFLSRHKKKIHRQCMIRVRKRYPNGRFTERLHIRNLFLHQSLGGMGVVAPEKFGYDVTMADKSVASFFAHFGTSGNIDLQRPVQGRDLKDVGACATPWVKVQSDIEPSIGEMVCKYKHSRLSRFKYAFRGLPLIEYGCRSLPDDTFSEILNLPTKNDIQWACAS